MTSVGLKRKNSSIVVLCRNLPCSTKLTQFLPICPNVRLIFLFGWYVFNWQARGLIYKTKETHLNLQWFHLFQTRATVVAVENFKKNALDSTMPRLGQMPLNFLPVHDPPHYKIKKVSLSVKNLKKTAGMIISWARLPHDVLFSE